MQKPPLLRIKPIFLKFFACLPACIFFLQPALLIAEQLPVRYAEGAVRGFLVLRAEDGQIIGDGDLTQVARNGRVTDHLVFRFKDGSIHDETTIFSQRGSFRLISDRVIQSGPSFKTPSETLIDAATGQVTIRLKEQGKEKVVSKRLEL